MFICVCNWIVFVFYFVFVIIGEDIDDGRIVVFEEVRLGCKVLFVKICILDVWLIIVEFRSNMEGFDICVIELDNIIEDVFDNDGISEFVLINDILVLFIVDEMRFVNKDDVGIGEVVFDLVEFFGWGVDGKIIMLFVIKEFVLVDDVKFLIKVVFGGSKIKFDEEFKKVFFDVMDERFELVVDIIVDKFVWLVVFVISSDVLVIGIKLFGIIVIDVVVWVINIDEDIFGIEEFNFVVDVVGKVDWSVVRIDGKFDEILIDVIRVFLLKDVVSEDVFIVMEMFFWDVEGIIVEEIIVWFVFSVIIVSEFKIDLFCDDIMVDLLGEEVLSIKDSVFVINVEFRDGVWFFDIVIVLLVEMMFVGRDVEELFIVSRSFEEVKIFVMLVFILIVFEDLNVVVLSNWFDVVKLIFIFGDKIIVLFGKIFEVVKLIFIL